MSAILCEGIDGSMAMLKIFKRYFKLKGEIAEIEEQVRTFGFKSVEECAVFVTVANSPAPCTRKDIEAKSNVGKSSTAMLSRLVSQHLVKSTEDPTDSRNRVLSRLLFSLTPNGVELYEQLKQQLQ